MGRRKHDPNRPWAAEDEIVLFDAIAKYKPVGVHKHVMMIKILGELDAHYNGSPYSREQIWQHLGELYDLEALDDSQADIFPEESVDFELPKDFKKKSAAAEKEKEKEKEKASKKGGASAAPTPASTHATRGSARPTRQTAQEETPTLRRGKRHASPALSPAETKRSRKG